MNVNLMLVVTALVYHNRVMTQFLLTFFVFTIWLAFCFAHVEVQIEGKEGWATKLPTWRLAKTHWVSRLFFGGREATGYHVWIQLFMLSIFHLPLLFTSFTWSHEFSILAMFIFFWIFEDFLWFVINPAYGIRSFKKGSVPWHHDCWWGFAPREYFIMTLVAAGLIYTAISV